MPKYRVTVDYHATDYFEIEADSEEDAHIEAYNMITADKVSNFETDIEIIEE